MGLWLDVEDMFHYALYNPRPSGIQRLSFEIYAELHALMGDDVHFCRHDPVGRTLRTVPWEVLRGLFTRLLEPRPVSDAPAISDSAAEVRRRAGLRRLAGSLPLAIRNPLAQAAAAQRLVFSAQRAVLLHGGRAILALPSLMRPPPGTEITASTKEGNSAAPIGGQDIREAGQPGDVFAVLGSPWFHTHYADFVDGLTRARGMQTALLVYDLIPLLRPEWCDQTLVRVFRDWFTNFIPRVDYVYAISDASARDVERWAKRTGTPVSLPVRTLPIGTGFSGPPMDNSGTLPPALRPGGFALFVSTIEARKNHLLAFRVWRRMVEEMAPEEVPTLVFAGRVGWLVNDLMQQLINCNYLDGKVMVIADPSDAQLVALYKNCRFTLFPSLYEGWGLPVTESLFFGKLCVASDRTSVPEAGGPFCLYVDPENYTMASTVIRQACTDDDLVARYETKIRSEFRPILWRSTAEALLSGLGIHRAQRAS